MYLSVFLVFVAINCVKVRTLDIFHEPWKTVFVPDVEAEYFGYSVLLSEREGLIVGAPKATSRANRSLRTGLLFSCKLNDLEHARIKCSDFDKNPISSNYFKDDMWLGATIAEIPPGFYVACAPRWTVPYMTTHLLAHGACFLKYSRNGRQHLVSLTPFYGNNNLAYVSDGSRKEYGEYGTHLNYYAMAQGGMAFKVTEDHSLLIGAPGLLHWAGGIAEYKYMLGPNNNSIATFLQPINNPYFTRELEPDEYFGYSVESGIFERNGKTLFVAGAPRSRNGYGQVFLFEPAGHDRERLKIHIKLTGPQLGSYFGATLSCVDVNGDGNLDLLVGAPNYVTSSGQITFDEGAVFVLLNKPLVKENSFILEEAGHLSGSGVSGARFGTAIAVLGDVDDDGYKDIAVGAPWELHSDKSAGVGAVYIFRGGPDGINKKYTQRIVAKNAFGFGISLTKGVDVDKNNCNDVAVGAFKSAEVYFYRCVPTIRVFAAIKVPNAMNFAQNATNFTAIFCISSPSKIWAHVKIGLQASIIVDPESDRADISGDSSYFTTISPGKDICEEQVVLVKKDADLSKPIKLTFKLEEKYNKSDESPKFRRDAARVSQDSELRSSYDIQLIRDCGEDMICTPSLRFNMTPLENPFIPGTSRKLGINITVFNKAEPSFGAKVHLNLPLQPKRVPGECLLVDFNMTCSVPSPLPRSGTVQWEIELEYNLKENYKKELTVTAVLIEPNEKRRYETKLIINPKFIFGLIGKVSPNITIPISRDTFYNNENITFVHNFQITNYGPSDWHYLSAEIQIPNMVNLTKPSDICDDEILPQCIITGLPANTTMPVTLPFIFDLKKYGNQLEELTKINFTSTVFINEHLLRTSVTTILILEPAAPIWPVIVGAIVGLLVLSAIIYGLHKHGFFKRHRLEHFNQLDEDDSSLENLDEPGPSGASGLAGDIAQEEICD